MVKVRYNVKGRRNPETIVDNSSTKQVSCENLRKKIKF